MSVSVEPLRKQKNTDIFVRVFRLVGVARLELAALRSRTVRATKLRYTPKILNFCKTLARLGARCACPLGLAVLTAHLKLTVWLRCRSFYLRSYRKPNCATPRLIMTAFRNIHHLSFFCNRNEKRKRKIIDYFAYLHKTFANQYSMLYNISRDGAWCSGSTWASDSHCVGSIPIAPANANTLTCESVLFLYPPPCLHERVGIKKER